MRRWLFPVFGATAFGALLTGASAHADEARIETASVMVRAWGKFGTVSPVGNAERRADRQLKATVNAGSIPRAVLLAELSSGISRFLRQVRTEAVVVKGQFVGWRMVKLFESRSDVHVNVLRVGDIVQRVNGQSIERPEAFKAVWDSLAQAPTLTLDVLRDGRPSQLKYTITP